MRYLILCATSALLALDVQTLVAQQQNLARGPRY